MTRLLMLMLALTALAGCGSILEPGGGLEAENVTYDKDGFHADYVKLSGIGQDRQVAFYKDTGVNPDTGEAYSTTDASYGSTVEPGVRARMDDNDRYVDVSSSIERGVDNTIQRAIGLAGLVAGAKGLGGAGVDTPQAGSEAGLLGGFTAADLLQLEPAQRGALLQLLGVAPQEPSPPPEPTVPTAQDPTIRAILEQLQDVGVRLDALTPPTPAPVTAVPTGPEPEE